MTPSMMNNLKMYDIRCLSLNDKTCMQHSLAMVVHRPFNEAGKMAEAKVIIIKDEPAVQTAICEVRHDEHESMFTLLAHSDDDHNTVELKMCGSDTQDIMAAMSESDTLYGLVRSEVVVQTSVSTKMIFFCYTGDKDKCDPKVDGVSDSICKLFCPHDMKITTNSFKDLQEKVKEHLSNDPPTEPEGGGEDKDDSEESEDEEVINITVSIENM